MDVGTGARGPVGGESASSAGSGGGVDFFVSYTGADEAWATWVAEVLEAAGRTVAVQAWDSPAGENFVTWISVQMGAAARTVAVCSQAYFASHWCTQEWTGALAGRKLTPLRVADCPVPPVLSTISYRDLFDVDEPVARRRLLEAVGLVHPVRVSGGFPGRPAAPPSVGAVFPGRLPAVWNVPARNLLFTGRDTLLDGLRTQLAAGTGRIAIAALRGAGGVGKSQLAVEFAWRYAADYQLVWWVDAETPAGLLAGLAALANTLGIGSGDLPVRAEEALAELGRRQSWLLVYDNVGDPTTLARMLPPATGRLVVTCRDPGVGRVGVELVEVGEFTRAESFALLRRYLPTLSDTAADQLADALGDLPLAVDQAGAFLATSGIPVHDYLALLATRPALLLAEETLHHPGLAATVTAARERLGSDHPGAAGLLDRLAFLAPEPIPLRPAGSEWLALGDPYTTHTALAAISRLALARRTDTTLQLHRLVHALLRARLTVDQRRTALAGALDLLATVYPGEAEDPSAWPTYATLTPHVTAVAGHLADFPGLAEPDGFRLLLHRTCWYLHCSGQNHSVRTLSHTTRTRWITTLGADHPDSQIITTALATALADLGEHRAARELAEDTLTRRSRVLGDDHPLTLQSANNLANQMAALGEHQAARKLAEDTLTRMRRLLGHDHPDTLASANNLTLLLADLGEHQAARELAEDTLTRRSRVLGDDHPHTLRSANNLAFHRAAVGEHQVARELAEDTLTRCRRVLGDDHPDTLASAHNLAIDLSALGEHQAARELAEETLTRRRRLLGDDHPHTRDSAGQLELLLEQLGPAL
ncbi:FxSxx-COOH system tetratricopeptide repeat protein [Frankia sp. EAN1pec]|uniref:FxSxx-COOH system tetratricopeptide repeat protein n=1 Tax=Parafrankia sp. (strain EAN1pec) TaxID=298653 RepID=UPI0007C44E4B